MSLSLDDPVSLVTGVSAKQARELRDHLDIVTVRDLIEHYPRRYEDLGQVAPLDEARIGEPVTLIGTVQSWFQIVPQRNKARRRTGTHKGRGQGTPGEPGQSQPGKQRQLTISKARVRDRGGSTFHVTFFNQAWRERSLPPGSVAAFSGTLQRAYGELRLERPSIQLLGRQDGHDFGRDGGWDEDLDERPLVAIYPASEKLQSWRLADWIRDALDELPPVHDHLPPSIRSRYGLLPLDEAVRAIHVAEDRPHAARARNRLAFDELFTLQVGLQWRRARLEAEVAGLDNAPVAGALADRFLAGLPFAPTGAQTRALEEIGVDLAAERPMHRLLQGDVGSGKTLVATWTMLCAVDHGRQAALMAPTEILAEQHHRTLTEQLAPLGVNVLDGVRVELLTASTPTSVRRRILGELLSGHVDLVVGTHALLEEGVRFADLGVVVVDEQHRFGVHQRVRLREKGASEGSSPDVLVMTATPIPRSLALTLFGDLDVTVLDELPPGRQEIVTQLITPDQAGRRERLEAFVRTQAAEGFQTYVVCPLVEESEEVGARAAEAEYERLRDEVFPDLRVGLVHGRMRGEDKDAVMEAFRRGGLDVLVATTVIEVGVDVPSATLMIVEDADRFGISQLHQLRGRVGRGTARSYCVLFAGWGERELSDEARARLEAVTATTDGFELARTDLELRGEGQLFGARQSGMPDLKLVRLARDLELVERTRDAARELIAADPHLASPEVAALRDEVRRRYREGLEELERVASG